jgi:hypothetical protein
MNKQKLHRIQRHRKPVPKSLLSRIRESSLEFGDWGEKKSYPELVQFAKTHNEGRIVARNIKFNNFPRDDAAIKEFFYEMQFPRAEKIKFADSDDEVFFKYLNGINAPKLKTVEVDCLNEYEKTPDRFKVVGSSCWTHWNDYEKGKLNEKVSGVYKPQIPSDQW